MSEEEPRIVPNQPTWRLDRHGRAAPRGDAEPLLVPDGPSLMARLDEEVRPLVRGNPKGTTRLIHRTVGLGVVGVCLVLALLLAAWLRGAP